MDIEKFYTNILSAESARIIRQMWEESNLLIDEIDYDKLSRYLGEVMNKDDILEEAFEEIVYTKKQKEKKKRKVVKKIGRKHSKKNINTRTPTEEKDSLDMVGKLDSKENDMQNKKKSTIEWIKPVRNPTKVEQRSMFGKALEMMIVLCMDNHVYQFGDVVRVQKEGGPIGLKLTGEVADCLMIDWDKKMLKELSKYNLIPEVIHKIQG